MLTKLQTISPFLWFDHQAEEAAKFYVSVFPNSSITTTTRYTAVGRGPEGSVMTVAFELDGQQFTALNGGPVFKLTEAISFVVNCNTQQEVDTYWEKLSKGGEPSQCGWLKDQFGLSWQIVPIALIEMIQDRDNDRATRVFKAMMQMKKLDLATLKNAYRG
ncbi:MAG TPA: VOC family protein [Bryobacteraceae bacterium]|nr:VOC family protein [Bryobacteraceae bacterium]